MKHYSSLMALLIAGFVLVNPVAAEARGGERVEVPVYSHNKAAFVDVNIGSSGPLSLFIDTAAAGIRIHPGNLKEQDIRHTGIADHIGYATGASGLIGEVVTGQVTLGSFVLPGDTPMQLITKHFCKEGEGEEFCGSAAKGKHSDAGTIGLQISGRAHFKKTKNKKEVLNPLLTQGPFSYILKVPRDDTKTGSLIINPTQKEKSRFVLIPINPNEGGNIPMCINKHCFEAVLDSGASFGGNIPVVSQRDIQLLGLPVNGNKIALDTSFHVVLGTGKNSLSVPLISGKREFAYHIKEKNKEKGLLGLDVFRYIDVLYDFQAGVIGVAMKD